jgi:broad specificity phosphatase PhoE
MALVILVRHGETGANRDGYFAHDDIPLTERGEQQAREAAAKLKEKYRPTRLLSSSFQRARQTAGFISEALGLPVEVLPDIHECNFGYLKGLPYAHIPPELKDPAWIPEGGESRHAVQARTLQALEGLLASSRDEQIVVVAHGVVIQSFCAHLAGTWENVAMPVNCGAVVATFDSGWVREFEIFE